MTNCGEALEDSCVTQKLRRRELVKEVALNLLLVCGHNSSLKMNSDWLEFLSLLSRQDNPLCLFVRTLDLQGTDA